LFTPALAPFPRRLALFSRKVKTDFLAEDLGTGEIRMLGGWDWAGSSWEGSGGRSCSWSGLGEGEEYLVEGHLGQTRLSSAVMDYPFSMPV
jgi:hypothetical protein